MQDLRSLITRGIEALKGKSFPRRVTAVNRSTRWQGYSGRSFETREEALECKLDALPYVRNASEKELSLRSFATRTVLRRPFMFRLASRIEGT